ncbi:hypothetical protein ACLOJK_015145 [Asimina triloba]
MKLPHPNASFLCLASHPSRHRCEIFTHRPFCHSFLDRASSLPYAAILFSLPNIPFCLDASLLRFSSSLTDVALLASVACLGHPHRVLRSPSSLRPSNVDALLALLAGLACSSHPLCLLRSASLLASPAQVVLFDPCNRYAIVLSTSSPSLLELELVPQILPPLHAYAYKIDWSGESFLQLTD